jgi:hypothetical protein
VAKLRQVNALRASLDCQTVQEWLGHESLATTQKYLGPCPSTQFLPTGGDSLDFYKTKTLKTLAADALPVSGRFQPAILRGIERAAVSL